MSSIDILVQELECPGCQETMTANIHQCFKGHNLCQNCYQIITVCPVCSEGYGRARNFSLEKLAKKMWIPGMKVNKRALEISKLRSQSLDETDSNDGEAVDIFCLKTVPIKQGKLGKKDIGTPMDFKHLGHVGMSDFQNDRKSDIEIANTMKILVNGSSIK